MGAPTRTPRAVNKGSQYEGGIGSYGRHRQPREHHPRQLKSCTERHPCIKVKCPDDPADPNYYLPICVDRRVVAPVIIAPTTYAAPVVARVAPHPPIVAPHPPVVAPIPQPAPVDAWTILAIILTVATFATAAFLAFLLLRALAALAKYGARSGLDRIAKRRTRCAAALRPQRPAPTSPKPPSCARDVGRASRLPAATSEPARAGTTMRATGVSTAWEGRAHREARQFDWGFECEDVVRRLW